MDEISSMQSRDWIEASARRLNALAGKLGFNSYLEIGVCTGQTFLSVDVPYRTGVDPQFLFDHQTHHDGDKIKLISTTSDCFFEALDPSVKFDLMFLDGLHTYDQTYRDLQNALLHSHENTVILIDDTWPCDVFSSFRDMRAAHTFRKGITGSDDLRWHGDTYKIVPLLRMFHPSHNFATIIDRGNPQTLVWRAQHKTSEFSNNRRRPIDPSDAFRVLENLGACNYLWFLQNQALYHPMSEDKALCLLFRERLNNQSSSPATAFGTIGTQDSDLAAPSEDPWPIEAAYKVNNTVTIGISAYGNSLTTRRCIEAVLQSLSGDYELVLVDDCSPDEGATLAAFAEARDSHPNTRIFSFKRNQEYSGSLNAILSHAQGDRIIFLSNDILATPSYFKMLLEAERTNGPGIYRGSSNFVDNGLDSHNISSNVDVQSLDDAVATSAEVASIYGPLAVPDIYLTGDAFMVSRDVINKIGTLDPLFYGYFADHDFGIRASIAGFPLFLVPGAWCYHEQGSNFNWLPQNLQQEKLSRRWSRIYENWARFKLKYDLPVEIPYTNINDVPWRDLASCRFSKQKHYFAPHDFSADLQQ